MLVGAQNWQLGESGYPELAGGVYYYVTDGYSPPTMNYIENMLWNVKNSQCPSGSLCVDPQLASENIDSFNALPTPTSPLLNWATASNSTLYDYRGLPRPTLVNGVTGYDPGAIQYQGESDEVIFRDSFED